MLNRSLLVAAALCLPLASMVGCASGAKKTDEKVTSRSLRADDSPYLQSMTRSYEQNLNLFSRTQDNRIRAIHDDIQTIFFLNHNHGLNEFEYPRR